MPTVMVIEALGNGRAKELQEMDFDELPRQGDLLTISLGTATAKFVVDAIIHKVQLGRKNKIVMRVRNVGSGAPARQGAPPDRQLPQQGQGQLQQLPAHDGGDIPAPDLNPGDYYLT